MPPAIPVTLSALHAAYRDGSLRPSEVVEAWLHRPDTERAAPVWIATHAAQALRERAARLDLALRDAPDQALASPVFGALYGVKDNIDVEGLATTAACPAFSRMPEAHAFVVAQLEAAGAIAVGKTNLDQFATGLVGTRSPFGAVPNAFAPDTISGGSSSGSAAAVARGQVHFALGTDTAGSGRVPAALNNIVGFKPTRGLVSTRGVVPACRSLDCLSIFALTVADAARVFQVAARFDALDPVARHVPLERPALRAGAFRFAVPREADLEFFGDALAQAAFAAAVARLRALGGTPCEIDFAPWREVADSLYDGPRVAERHAGIRDFFDGHAQDVEPTVRGIVERGRAYSASDAFAAEARLDALRARLAPLWSTFDVLVVPGVPTAYKIAAVQADPVELNRRLGIYTNFANLLDLAAIAVPASMRADGLPSGITLLAPAGSDLMLAGLAQRFESTTGLALGATGAPAPPSEPLAGRRDVAQLAVVGAHLQGLPLNRELTERGARLVRSARTAPHYRLYALPASTPAKPGLVRTGGDGHRIAVEVWELPVSAFGRFVVGVPPPLCIGTLELEDGSHVQGFLCEAAASAGAEDISRFGGWRAFLERPQKETT